MSKKLLPTLIAALFASGSAFGQSDSDPMRIQGTGTVGGIHNSTSATDRAQLDQYQDLGNGVMTNVGIQGRNSTNTRSKPKIKNNTKVTKNITNQVGS